MNTVTQVVWILITAANWTNLCLERSNPLRIEGPRQSFSSTNCLVLIQTRLSSRYWHSRQRDKAFCTHSFLLGGDCTELEPIQRRVKQQGESRISDVTAKLTIYRAFVDTQLDAANGLMASVPRI